jgi:serine/threonine protein kinase
MPRSNQRMFCAGRENCHLRMLTTGFAAGYMAPEVFSDGDCSSASDIYSAGVSLIELWNGGIWAGAQTRGEGSDGMRSEALAALTVIERAEPDVGSILRRMVSLSVSERPSAVAVANAEAIEAGQCENWHES